MGRWVEDRRYVWWKASKHAYLFRLLPGLCRWRSSSHCKSMAGIREPWFSKTHLQNVESTICKQNEVIFYKKKLYLDISYYFWSKIKVHSSSLGITFKGRLYKSEIFPHMNVTLVKASFYQTIGWASGHCSKPKIKLIIYTSPPYHVCYFSEQENNMIGLHLG